MQAHTELYDKGKMPGRAVHLKHPNRQKSLQVGLFRETPPKMNVAYCGGEGEHGAQFSYMTLKFN